MPRYRNRKVLEAAMDKPVPLEEQLRRVRARGNSPVREFEEYVDVSTEAPPPEHLRPVMKLQPK